MNSNVWSCFFVPKFRRKAGEINGLHILYNTGISTYVWILTNRKTERRQGKIRLVNGVSYSEKMRKSLGSKRNVISEENRKEIVSLYAMREPNENYIDFDNDTETVPLGEDIHEYFKREVLPHISDAWIDESKTKIGYEIPFTKYFYRFTPLRDVARGFLGNGIYNCNVKSYHLLDDSRSAIVKKKVSQSQFIKIF